MYVEGRIKNAGPFQNDPGCFINGQTYSLEVVRCKVGGHVHKYAVMVAHALQVYPQSLKCFSFTIGYRLHSPFLNSVGPRIAGKAWLCYTIPALSMNCLPVYARAILFTYLARPREEELLVSVTIVQSST